MARTKRLPKRKQAVAETQIKLLLDPRQLSAIRHDRKIRSLQVGRGSVRHVVSIYYDTPDHALRRAGLALRLRNDRGHWLQTLMTSEQAVAGVHQREKWEWPLVSEALDFGLLAAIPEGKLFSRAALRAALAPVCNTEFERVQKHLGIDDNSHIVLSLDKGRIRSGRRNAPICELRIELVSGSSAKLHELGLDLLERFPLRLGSQSTTDRGYVLASGIGTRPVKAAKLKLSTDATVASAFADIVRNCMLQLHANETGFLESKDPEHLHQLRVATRRLRACFSLFDSVLPQQEFVSLRNRLRECAGALGPARDWDVFVIETLKPLRTQFPDSSTFDLFERRCALLRRACLRAAKAIAVSPVWQRMWLELGQLLVSTEWHNLNNAVRQPLLNFSAKSLQRRARIVRKCAGHVGELDAAGRHALRIAAKKLRYAAEFFASLYPNHKVQPYVQALSQLQDVLGQLNDAATSLQLCDAALAGSRVPQPRVEGIIIGWSAANTHLQLDSLKRALEQWRKQEAFWSKVLSAAPTPAETAGLP
jgi:inorganic triphosphatase YgiF